MGAYTGNSYWRIRTPTTEVSSSSILDVQECSDTIGNRPNPNGLLITKRMRGPIGLLSGKKFMTIAPYSLDKEYSSYPVAFVVNAPLPPTWSPSTLELANHSFTVKEATNPSKPHVSVPTIIGELKDLPSLVRDWGGSLLRKAAKGNLTWRWAVRPMMSDIRKILDFQRAVDQRMRELNRLSSAGYVSKRYNLGSTTSVVNDTNVVVESTLSEIVTCGRMHVTTTKTWGSCRWKTSSAFPIVPKSNDARRKLAYRLTSGITGYESLAATWELLPWSWFVDWFGGIGDMISAGNNTLGLLPGSFCIMRTGETYTHYHLVSKPSWVTFSGLPSTQRSVKKQRFVSALTVPPLPSLTPLVSADKWLILASLAALKGKT